MSTLHTLPKIHPHSAFTLTLTVTTTSSGAAVTGATVTVTLVDAKGVKQLTDASMPHIGAGVYSLNVDAAKSTQPGRYVADYTVANSGVESSDRLEFLVAH